MAYLVKIHCSSCDKQKEVFEGQNGFRPNICDVCRDKKLISEKDERLAVLKKLPIEERITKIEEWIDAHSQVKHGYIAPKRY